MKLNDLIIQSAEAKGKSYKLFDGQGLYIEISSKGSKLWRLKYRFEGKEKRISLGAYPEISIEAARDHMRLCKEQLKGGTDPSQARKDSNQSITVPPKIESIQPTSSPIQFSNVNDPDEQKDLNSKSADTAQLVESEEGAFLDDLGALNEKEDNYPQNDKKDAAEDDYAPPQTDQPKMSPGDAAILEVLNELKSELELLRQENRFLKDQLSSAEKISNKDHLSADNLLISDKEGFDESQYQLHQSEVQMHELQEDLPPSQQELPQSQEELPQFTFIKTKKRLLPAFNLSIKGYLISFFSSIKAAIRNGAATLSRLVNLFVKLITGLVRELIDLGTWIFGVIKGFLSFTWLLVLIDRIIFRLGQFINATKPKLKQLFIIKPASISLSAQHIKIFLSKMANVFVTAFKSIYEALGKILGILSTGLLNLYASLKALVKSFIVFATKSKQNMAYVILLTFLPIVIYLISQGYRSKEINQDIIPIEGETEPITVDDIKGTGDFYIPQDVEEPEATAPDAPKADAPKADAPKAVRKSSAQIIYPYPKNNNWKDSFNYVQVDYFTYYFRPNEYKPNLSDEAKKAFKTAAVNNIYLVVEGFSDARGDEQSNLVAAKRRANEFTNQLYVLGFNKEQIIDTFYDAPKISADCIEPMCSFYRKTHVSVYVKKEFYDELKERAKLKQLNQEAFEKSQEVAPAPKQVAPAPKQAAPAPKQAAPAPKQAAPALDDPNDKVSTIDFTGLTNPMPNVIDGYRLTARLTYYFGLYESMPNLDDNMVKNLKELFNKPDQKFAVEGFENISDNPNQDIQIAQGRAVMMKDELIKLGLAEDRMLGVFYNVPQESKGCVEIGCAKGRKVVINLFNK